MAEGVVQEGKTLKELEKEITCSVCQEHYTEPKVLPCLHYYCKECVLRLALRTASNKPFSCPECREETTLPEGGVEELRTAFFINRLRSNFSALERVHGKIEVTCEGCNSGSKAEAFCRHCAVFICKECVLSHKKLKAYSSHEVASLEDLKQGRAKQIAVAEPATKKCSIHEEPLLIYCYDCDSLICRDCTVIDHRDHKFQFSKVAAPEMKKCLLEDLVPFKEVSTKFSTAADVIATTRCEVEAQRKCLVDTIEASFERLHHILEERKKELVQEAVNKVDEKVEMLSAQEKKILTANAEVQSIVEYTERFVGHCSDNEVMSMHTDIRRQIKREIEEHSKSETSLEPVEVDVGVEVRCEEELQQLCQTKAKIILGVDPAQCTVSGEGAESAEVYQTAEVTLTTRLSNNKTTRRSTEVVSELKSLYNGSVMKCNVDQSGPGEYRIQYTPTVRGRHELTVSVDGQQVAGSPFPVFVSISPTQLGKPVKVWVNINYPRGITTNSENNVIVVGDKGCILKLDKNEKKTVLVSNSLSQLTNLIGIATDSEDNIYCTDRESNKIMKCDKNGGNVQVYEVHQVVGPGHRGVAVVGDEVMLCEHNNEGNIMIYDRELKHKRHIQQDDAGEFYYISADLHSNIYVTDYHEYIRVFSKEGVFLHSFGCDSNGVARLETPYGVCVSGCYVYVTDFDGDNVSVFTTSGDYVTSFGQCGNNEDDFLGPYGVCVDKDGFVYVADCCNHRVQCF